MKRGEKGAVMVEATIYMPLVLCTVMALIYLALFNMQEYMMMYEAQRVAFVAAREEAYLGYKKFGMGADQEIDFQWGDGIVPSKADVSSYYQARHEHASEMYRELFGWFSDHSGSYESRFAGAAREAALIALGSISEPRVDIQKNLLGTKVVVTFTHSLPVPGVIRYLGWEGGMTIRTAAYSYSVDPAGFVRNVDLAADLVSYIFEKLGMQGQYQDFLSKAEEVIQKIL